MRCCCVRTTLCQAYTVLIREDDGLQADFMATIHGVKSFAALRASAKEIDLGGYPLLVASLSVIVKSKRAAGRPRDHAVLDILEASLREEEARNQSTKTRGPKGRK